MQRKVTVRRGRRVRTLILVNNVQVKVGDVLTLLKLDWTITKIVDADLFEFRKASRGRLRLVFP